VDQNRQALPIKGKRGPILTLPSLGGLDLARGKARSILGSERRGGKPSRLWDAARRIFTETPKFGLGKIAAFQARGYLNREKQEKCRGGGAAKERGEQLWRRADGVENGGGNLEMARDC